MRQVSDNDIGLNEYQRIADKTAIYPDKDDNYFYPLLGLVGEVGELAEKIKKLWRDKDTKKQFRIMEEDSIEIKKELGDILWYLAMTSNELGFYFADIAQANINKLQSRQERNVIKGVGDNR